MNSEIHSKLEWTIEAKEAGLKLLTFLTQKLEGKYSSRALKRLIEQNGCLVNKRNERFASTIVAEGDHIQLYLYLHPSASFIQMEKQRILYEDESLLVYNKPAGINSDEKGIVALLKKYCSSVQIVHRLDRDTTGALIFAKQPSIFDHLVQQFKNLQVKKQYQALVEGTVKQAQGMVKNYLGKKKEYAGQTIWGEVLASKGLYACTKWQCLKKNQIASYLLCMPETGRTHQIRVHLAEMGHPILGDFQYGKFFKCPYRPSRYLLHAEKICFQHPLTGQEMEVISPLPDDFQAALQKIFKGTLSL